MRFSTPILLLTLLLAGCGHTPQRETIPAALPPFPAENGVTQKRAEELKKILAPFPIRGTALFPAAFPPEGQFSDDVIFKAIRQCGFNRVYCHITSEQELNDRLRHFLAAASAAGFPVEIVISQIDYYRRYHANQLIRWALIQYPDLVKAAELVTEFNESLPEDHRFAGITVHIAPDVCDGKNVERMYGRIYRWQENRYGKGGDNDMLMREAFADLRKIAAIEKLPRLTIAFQDFYHEKAREGELSVGTVKDFAAISKRLTIVNTANLPSRISKNIADELEDAPADVRITATIPLAHHTSVDTARLRRRNWADFIRAIAAATSVSGKDDNFRGVVIAPFAVVEYMRLEK